MLAESFPHNIYYNDAADDKVDFHEESNEDTARELCGQMINALKICEIFGDELRKRLLGIEIPGVTEQIVDELLGSEGGV